MFKDFGTKKLLVTLSISTIVALSIYLLVYIYILQSYGRISWGAGQLQNVAENGAKLAAEKRIMNDVSVEREKINSYILSEQVTVQFIEQIESLGKAVGVTLSVDSVGTAAATGDFKKQWEYLTMVISTKGSFAQTFNLLSMLENLPYQSQIDNVSIEKETSDPSKKTPIVWDGQFSLSVLKSKQ